MLMQWHYILIFFLSQIIQCEGNWTTIETFTPEAESDVTPTSEAKANVTLTAESESVVTPTPESESELTQAPEAEPELTPPVAESEATSTPEVDSEVTSTPEAEAESDVTPPDAESEVTPTPEAGSGITQTPEAESEVTSEPEAEYDGSSEPETQSEVTSEPEAESEVTSEPEAHVTSEPEAQSEVTSEPESESVVTSEPESESVVTSEPETESEVTSKPETESLVTSEPESESEVTSEPEAESLVTSEPESESEVTSEPESESEVTSEPNSESEVTSEPEAESLVTSEPESESEVTSEPETESLVTSESESESEVTSEPESESEVTSEPESESEVTSEPESESEVTSEPESESEVTSEPESLVTSEPESDSVVTSEPETESVVTSEPETDPESISEPEQQASGKPESVAEAEPSATEIMVPPFSLVILVIMALIGLYLYSNCRKHPIAAANKQIRSDSKLQVISLEDYDETCMTCSSPFLTTFDLEVVDAFQNHHNKPLDLLKISFPALLSLALCPLTLYLYTPMTTFIWPKEDYPTAPDINDAIACFLAPAGLVYATSFGFDFQQALTKQSHIMDKVTKEISMIDQIATFCTRINLPNQDLRRRVYKHIKAEIIFMVLQILDRKPDSFKEKPNVNVKIQIWSVIDVLREVNIDMSDNKSHIDRVLCEKILSHILQLNSICSDRLGVLHTKIHPVKWAFLETLGFFSFVGILLLKAFSYKMELVMCIITVFSISMLCYVVSDLDSPFSGFFRVDLSVLIDVLRRIESLHDSNTEDTKCNTETSSLADSMFDPS